MTRGTVTLDRVATALFGILLVAVGCALLLWNTSLIDGIPEVLTAPGLVTAAESSWWPWAVAGLGVVLVLLAIRWLISHRPAPRVDRSAIERTASPDGDDVPGRSTADVGALATASARALEAHACVRKASGKAVVDRRQRTIVIDVTALSPELVGEAAAAADRVAQDAVTMIGDRTLATRVTVHVDKRRKTSRQLD